MSHLRDETEIVAALCWYLAAGEYERLHPHSDGQGGHTCASAFFSAYPGMEPSNFPLHRIFLAFCALSECFEISGSPVGSNMSIRSNPGTQISRHGRIVWPPSGSSAGKWPTRVCLRDGRASTKEPPVVEIRVRLKRVHRVQKLRRRRHRFRGRVSATPQTQRQP